MNDFSSAGETIPEREACVMDMTNTDYGKYVNAKSQPSPSGKNCLWAFCVGGLICTLGQVLLNFYQSSCGLEKDDAAAAVSISLILLSAVLTGLGIFDKIAKHAGAGTLVPITGFANAVVSPAIDFKSEGIVTGMAAKMFLVAGPVIVFGTLASVVYGVVLMLTGG